MAGSINTVTRDLIVPAYTPDTDGLGAFVPASNAPSLYVPVIFYNKAPGLAYTSPAATFTALTVADNAGYAQLASAGIHSLTAAAVGRYINVASGTGWVTGPVKVKSVDDGNTITLDVPHASSLGVPVVTLAGGTASANTYNVAEVMIPAGFLGPSGSIEWHVQTTLSATANNKVVQPRLGGRVGGSLGSGAGQTYSSSHTNGRAIFHMFNVGAASQKFGASGAANTPSFSSSATTYSTASIDTSVDQYASLSLALATADEAITVEHLRIVGYPSV